MTRDNALRFSLPEGEVSNHFLREGADAVHATLRPGHKPLLTVASLPGNVLYGLRFRREGMKAEQALSVEALRVLGTDGDDGTLLKQAKAARPEGDFVRQLHGVRLSLSLAQDAALVLTSLSAGSARVVRKVVERDDTALDARYALSFETPEAQLLHWHRRTLDGHTLHILLRTEGVELSAHHIAGQFKLTPRADTTGRLHIDLLSDYRAMKPMHASRLLRDAAGADARLRNILDFLSYEEAWLAGSWRFNTYFGRDTLLSLRLLMRALRPEAIEAALGTVLRRVGPEGQVAHEEALGEAALALATPAEKAERAAREPGQEVAPIFDYTMIDDDFLLAPVLAHYLVAHPEGPARAAAFLAQTAGDQSYLAQLQRNLAWVITQATPYAEKAERHRLVALRKGTLAGQWRDSKQGLGSGRIPYDVNVALVPAALRAAQALRPLLNDPELLPEPAQLAHMISVWEGSARHFVVERDAAATRTAITRYADEVELASLTEEDQKPSAARFFALALDTHGKSVDVLHSDTAFRLLFGKPDAQELRDCINTVFQPFPRGLLSPVGMVVANPVYAETAATRRLFTRGHYHGTVVWSWQQALMAEALRHQLERRDLTPPLRTLLHDAERRLWSRIDATKASRNAELWSWRIDEGGRFALAPFGQSAEHVSESNAAQLWSTVYLAVRRPVP